ncbi:MAG: SPOR domain-containing protein [Hyphomicrobiaceae bacterium]
MSQDDGGQFNVRQPGYGVASAPGSGGMGSAAQGYGHPNDVPTPQGPDGYAIQRGADPVANRGHWGEGGYGPNGGQETGYAQSNHDDRVPHAPAAPQGGYANAYGGGAGHGGYQSGNPIDPFAWTAADWNAPEAHGAAAGRQPGWGAPELDPQQQYAVSAPVDDGSTYHAYTQASAYPASTHAEPPLSQYFVPGSYGSHVDDDPRAYSPTLAQRLETQYDGPSRGELDPRFGTFDPAGTVPPPGLRGAAFEPEHGFARPEPAEFDGFGVRARAAQPADLDHDLSNFGWSNANANRVEPGLGQAPEFGTYSEGARNAGVYGYQGDPYSDPSSQPFDGYGGTATMPVAAQDRVYDDADDEDDELPARARNSRWKRGVAIAASLIVFVMVGGGVLYGYNAMFGGAPSQDGPIVRASTGPTKVKPDDPGGQRFANTDSRLLDRLDEGRGVPAAERSERVRTVSTMVVRPDGTVVEETRPATPPIQPLPGIAFVGDDPAPPAQGAPPSQRTDPVVEAPATSPPPLLNAAPRGPSASAPTTSPPPNAPVVVNNSSGLPVTPGSVSSASDPLRDVPLPARNRLPRTDLEPERAPPVAREVASAAEAEAPLERNVRAPVTTAPSSGLGFVAVIASKGSRIEALKAFADLRERYTTALSGAIPDVQEADLSSRGLGMMYRVVIGPPASRDAANDVCARLRSAGYSDCWVKAY